MSIKYVIVDEIKPRLLSKADTHADVARYGATSAGFCSIHEENGRLKVQVWGESISLKLKSQPHDADLIERMLIDA